MKWTIQKMGHGGRTERTFQISVIKRTEELIVKNKSLCGSTLSFFFFLGLTGVFLN